MVRDAAAKRQSRHANTNKSIVCRVEGLRGGEAGRRGGISAVGWIGCSLEGCRGAKSPKSKSKSKSKVRNGIAMKSAKNEV